MAGAFPIAHRTTVGRRAEGRVDTGTATTRLETSGAMEGGTGGHVVRCALVERRVDLAEFLRARRAALTPEQVGLVPGPRRRTPGLRREEVAMLAGVSVSWYTWLEQGRPINVSDEVLDSLARVLQLDSVECRYLAELAGHHDHLADARPVNCPTGDPACSPPSTRRRPT